MILVSPDSSLIFKWGWRIILTINRSFENYSRSQNISLKWKQIRVEFLKKKYIDGRANRNGPEYSEEGYTTRVAKSYYEQTWTQWHTHFNRNPVSSNQLWTPSSAALVAGLNLFAFRWRFAPIGRFHCVMICRYNGWYCASNRLISVEQF